MAAMQGMKGTVASKLVTERVASLLESHRLNLEASIKKAAKLVSEKSKTKILGIFPRRQLGEAEVEKMIRDCEDAPWWWSWANGLWPVWNHSWVDIPGGGCMTVRELEAVAWLAAKGGSTVQLDASICMQLGLRLRPQKND